MKKVIHLDELTLPVQVGIHDFERKGPQPYTVSVWLTLENGYWTVRDRIEETVNYDLLRQRITAHLTSGRFDLQETLAQDILALCFALDSRVTQARVTVAKPAVYPDCKAVGLDYSCCRAEWQAWRPQEVAQRHHELGLQPAE